MGALETATIILENHCRTADTWRAMAGNHWHLYLFDFGLCLCQFRHKHHGECYKKYHSDHTGTSVSAKVLRLAWDLLCILHPDQKVH